MGASIDSNKCTSADQDVVTETILSGLQAAVTVNIPSFGTSGLAPYHVTHVVTTLGTTGDPIYMAYTGYDSSANTFAVEFNTISNGTMTSAIVKVIARWRGHASGGIDDFV